MSISIDTTPRKRRIVMRRRHKPFAEYREGLHTAGFTDVDLTPTHQAADGMHSVIVRARKPQDSVV